ncbi:unnamed protein product [Cylindrotheca closterium]|uniref:DUF202 domain-containing protein n=1 Tax=Cylindrotheca closterium TaxID=2856 RepID=A0AAD2GBP3_9STRA|nr:unnamed protein product [Cylindrotheca closterium]
MDTIQKRIKAACCSWTAPNNSVRVEPKTYFANERTFIQWVSAALFLVTTSALLLEFENGEGYAKSTAITLLVFALIIAVYSLGLYYLRIWLMKHGRPYGYTSHFGPIVLSGAAIAGTWIILSRLQELELAELAARNNGGAEPEVAMPSIRSEAGVCMEHDVSSFSSLEFEPSDALIDEDRNLLLVPTLSEIYGFPLPAWNNQGQLAIPKGSTATVVARVERADFESATFVDANTLYAVSEVATATPDMAAVVYSFQRDLLGNFEVSGQWKLATPEPEGMAFVQQGGTSSLYISGLQGASSATIQKFSVPEPNGLTQVVQGSRPAILPSRRLNTKLLDKNLKDPKIGSMQYFESVLYVLHDNARVVRAWDIATGAFQAEWQLPNVPESNGMQWEGMFLQRVQRPPSALRGSDGDSVLLLHLTHDTPAAIWSIVVEEGNVRGSIVFPECASVAVE